MPRYRVQSGRLDRTIETPYEAEPTCIAAIAFTHGPFPKTLGRIIGISGGSFTGDDEVFIETMSFLKKIGRAARDGADIPEDQITAALRVTAT